MITQRAVLVGIVGFCLYLIAFVNVLPTFYVLTWLSVGILVSSLGIGLLALVGLDCVWHITQARASEETAGVALTADQLPNAVARQDVTLMGPLLEVQLANGGTLNKIGVLLEVRLQSLTQDEVIVRRFLLEALPSGASIEASLPLGGLPRGRYRVEEVCLIGSDVLGLFRMQKRITARDQFKAAGAGRMLASRERPEASPAPGQQPFETAANDLVIGPAMVAMQDAALMLGLRSGTLGRSQMMGQSDELRSTRPYAAGDDLRRVHWKSTARHGQLVVKEFYQTTQNGCVVIWDGAADTTLGAGGVTSSEYGLRLVASLCRVFNEAGRPYTLLRLDSKPLQLATTEQGRAMGQMLPRVIEALADADAARATLLSSAMARFAGSLTAGSEVFLVTASLSPDLPQAALRWSGSGAQFHVALVDAAAFLDLGLAKPSRYGVGRPLAAEAYERGLARRAASAPGQHELSDSASRGATPVSVAAYQAQAQALAAAGISVVTLAPLADAPRDFAPPVRRALRALLEPQTRYANYTTH